MEDEINTNGDTMLDFEDSDEGMLLPGAEVDGPSRGRIGNIQNAFGSFLKRRTCACKHPITSFFTLFWKVLTLVVFSITSSWVLNTNFVTRFIITVILLAIDFWMVKNISGRILVGLRWWNEVNEDGESSWRFESKDDRENIDPIDSTLFWVSLTVWPFIWFLFIIWNIVSLTYQSLLIILFALILSISNTIGYLKCLKDAKSKVTNLLFKGYVSYLNRQTNQSESS
mmetsp:Transcript_7216/g.10621  ORF Transcript_7216/g.10621 Transcript_7216/m.10621 type:complete len:227 (+) Transcript_7216:48-728(+)